MEKHKSKGVIRNDEIDLIELLRVVWNGKSLIAKVVGIFILLGLIVAFTSPKEYETSCSLIPESINNHGNLGGSLGGLASLAGVDLGGLTGANQGINPALYQSVSRSTPFLLELMKQEYFFSDLEETMSVYDYYSGYLKVSLISWIISSPGRLIELIKGNPEEHSSDTLKETEVINLTKREKVIAEDLSSRILVEMDWELNLVTIRVQMQDPIVAAQIAMFTQNYITQYVTKYSISKSKQQLESIEEQYTDQMKKFEQAQYRLAEFRDQNLNVTTARAQTEEERLKSEYSLSFNVYSQLAQQREAIKLQVKNNTPVFTVLEPVKVPVEKSKPKRGLILVISVFLGFILSVLIILTKEFSS